MNYVKFGRTGEKVSEMSLGTMMFGDRCDQAETERILVTAMEHGVNFIDTAAMYCNGTTERILGRIIKGRRDKLFIATKVHKGVDAESILGSIDESLARLQVDHVDLYMIHWPKEGMNPEEVMEALNSVVVQGKARYVGCCNYPAWLYCYSNAIAARNDWAPLVAIKSHTTSLSGEPRLRSCPKPSPKAWLSQPIGLSLWVFWQVSIRLGTRCRLTPVVKRTRVFPRG